jgi:3-oxoacyl-[acyl-carrier protein] reductase
MAFNLTLPKNGAVLVFGGSGGAGSAIVRGFAKTGAKVAFTYRTNKRKAETIVAELTTGGGTVSASQVDITDLAAVKRAVDEVVVKYGLVHCVVYASGPQWDSSLQMCDVPPDTFEFLIKSELIGFFNIIHSTISQLRAHRGVLVACTTFANQRAFDRDGQSAVPKAGIESFVRQIAAEEAQNGIRANVVGLGWFNFGMGALDGTETQLDDPGRTQIPGDAGAEAVAWMTSRIRLGNRPGRGEELANTVVFLASEQASYITGQLLCVDGGISL